MPAVRRRERVGGFALGGSTRRRSRRERVKRGSLRPEHPADRLRRRLKRESPGPGTGIVSAKARGSKAGGSSQKPFELGSLLRRVRQRRERRGHDPSARRRQPKRRPTVSQTRRARASTREGPARRVHHLLLRGDGGFGPSEEGPRRSEVSVVRASERVRRSAHERAARRFSLGRYVPPEHRIAAFAVLSRGEPRRGASDARRLVFVPGGIPVFFVPSRLFARAVLFVVHARVE